MTDPYVLPNGCLKNKLGLDDSDLLAQFEARIVSSREVSVARETLPGEYNLEHWCSFHRVLFADVYEWAGKLRTVDIAKENSMFCHWRYIGDQASAILGSLEGDGWLAGWSRDAFLDKLSYYYGELNAIHPFREGNGRTLRAFLRQLSAAAGWRLDWSGLDDTDNVEASRDAFLGDDHSKLRQVLDPIVHQI